MTNESILQMRENVVSWYNELTETERLDLLESLECSSFVDEILTPIYCKLHRIILE
jgi:hypothetical protein